MFSISTALPPKNNLDSSSSSEVTEEGLMGDRYKKLLGCLGLDAPRFSHSISSAVTRRKVRRQLGVFSFLAKFFDWSTKTVSEMDQRMFYKGVLLLCLVFGYVALSESMLGQTALSWKALEAERQAQADLLMSYSRRELERNKVLESWNDEYNDLFEATLEDLEAKHAELIDAEMGRYLKRHQCDPVDQLQQIGREFKCNLSSYRITPSFLEGLFYSFSHVWLRFEAEDAYRGQIKAMGLSRGWRLLAYLILLGGSIKALQWQVALQNPQGEKDSLDDLVEPTKTQKKNKKKKSNAASSESQSDESYRQVQKQLSEKVIEVESLEHQLKILQEALKQKEEETRTLKSKNQQLLLIFKARAQK